MLAVRRYLLAFPSMMIMIEDAETLEFLGNNGQWTKNTLEGKHFAGTNEAMTAAKKELIGKFNIVCYIAETKQFINMNHGRGKGLETVPA